MRLSTSSSVLQVPLKIIAVSQKLLPGVFLIETFFSRDVEKKGKEF